MTVPLHIRRLPAPVATALSLFLFSVGSGFLSLIVYRLIALLGAPTGLFLLLFLGGMPGGALIGLRRQGGRRAPAWSISDGYGRGLVLLILAFLVSIILFILFNNLVGWAGSDVWNWWVMVLLALQALAGAMTFLPFFTVYGWCEFAGYRVGVEIFSSRARMVYGLYLVGLGCAYLIMLGGLPYLGLLRFIPLAFLALLYSLAIHRRRMTWASVCLTMLVIASAIPNMESLWIRAFDLKRGSGGADAYIRSGGRTVYQGWGRYCHITMMRLGNTLQGFYDRLPIWTVPGGTQGGIIAFMAYAGHVPRGASFAVIGAGGGKQVKEVLEVSPRRVVAIEVVPEVLSLLAGPLSREVDGVYNDPRVELVSMGGRQYLERKEEKFDVIYLSSVEVVLVSFRTLLEPSMYLYTTEALGLYMDHLSPDGLLIISKMSEVDKQGNIFSQIGTSLRRHGWNVEGIVGQGVPWEGTVNPPPGASTRWYIIGHKSPWPPLSPTFLDMIHASGHRFLSPSEWRDISPITDDNPYPVSVFAGLSVREAVDIAVLYAIAAGGPLVLLLWYLVRQAVMTIAAPRGPVMDVPWFVVACLLVGGNFMLLENFIIYELYKVLPVPMDAIFMGTLLFLGVAVAGNVMSGTGKALAPYLIGLALVCVIVSILLHAPMLGVVGGIPLYFLTGRFFPSIFQGPPKRLASVFVLDLVGTILGGGIALFLPILGGFRAYKFFCLVIFLASYYAVTRFTAPRKSLST